MTASSQTANFAEWNPNFTIGIPPFCVEERVNSLKCGRANAMYYTVKGEGIQDVNLKRDRKWTLSHRGMMSRVNALNRTVKQKLIASANYRE